MAIRKTKTVVSSAKTPSVKKIVAKQQATRIQTAEGWKRSQLLRRKPSKVAIKR